MGIRNNIAKTLDIIEKTDDKVYSKAELLSAFEFFINDSGFTINKWINKKNNPYEVLLMDKEGRIYRIVFFLKNITHAGWADKPWIKRTQVSNVREAAQENFINTETTQTLLILGYYNYDNNPLMVGWNAYSYVMHNTIRSCYVTVDEMVEGYKKGYHTCLIAHEKAWIFTPSNFNVFLKNYINEHKIEE